MLLRLKREGHGNVGREKRGGGEGEGKRRREAVDKCV